MRFLLLALLLLTGCVDMAIGVAKISGHQAIFALPDRATREETVQREPPPRPPTARELHDREVIRRARLLTSFALTAAQREDCEQVSRIQQHVLALPEVQLEGGVHDVIFLREPAIVQCLAKRATGPS